MKFLLILWMAAFSALSAAELPFPLQLYSEEEVTEWEIEKREKILCELENRLLQELTHESDISVATSKLKHYFEKCFQAKGLTTVSFHKRETFIGNFLQSNYLGALGLTCTVISWECSDHFIRYFLHAVTPLLFLNEKIENNIQLLSNFTKAPGYLGPKARQQPRESRLGPLFQHWDQINRIQTLIKALPEIIDPLNRQYQHLVDYMDFFKLDINNYTLDKKTVCCIYLSLLLILEDELKHKHGERKSLQLIRDHEKFPEQLATAFDKILTSYLNKIFRKKEEFIAHLEFTKASRILVKVVLVRSIASQNLACDNFPPNNLIFFLIQLINDVDHFQQAGTAQDLPTKITYEHFISTMEWLTIYVIFKKYPALLLQPELRYYLELAEENLQHLRTKL